VGATLCALVAVAQPALGMPRNSRQVPEGYWVGGAPVASDIRAMREEGIRVIVSGVMLDEETRAESRRAHIERVNVWFGSSFPDAERLLEGTADYFPEEIYIHCDHGGDRAGALLAFLLVAREGWEPDHALLAVAFPNERDVTRLVELLDEAGFEVTEEERATLTGIYSGASNGGTGGLKVRSEGYRNLVRTTLAALEAQGFPGTDRLTPSPDPSLLPAEGATPPVAEEEGVGNITAAQGDDGPVTP
jgi:hypothetical protein